MTTQANFPAIRPSLLLDFANSGQVDPRVTFTRASTATYYDIDTVAKAEENLILRSQAFNITWGLLAAGTVTITQDSTTAPDGTSTAATLAETATTNTFAVQQDNPSAFLANTTYTLSVFAKDVTRRYIGLTLFGGSGNYGYVEFDLTGAVVARSGAAGTGYSVVSSSITSVGNSWYRCVATITVGTTVATARQRIWLSNGVGAIQVSGVAEYTGTTNSLYVWGAQLEQRSAVTAYTATTTQAITNYVPQLMTASAGRPRIDYNPITRAPLGLLIEESRQNLVTYSEDLSNAAWTKTNTVINSNVTVAPDGALTADNIIANTTASVVHEVFNALSITSGTVYTISGYFKKAGYEFVQITLAGSTGHAWANFNLTTGAIASTSSPTVAPTITSVGNGWYRCVLTATAAVSSGGGIVIGALPSDLNSRRPTFTGDGYSGIYAWGAQFETAAFPTSYIPTVASAVTRSADAASMTGTNFSSWYNASEGTLYAEYRVTAATVRNAAAISDNTLNNRIILRANNASGSGNAVSIGSVGGAVQWNDSAGTPSLTQLNKFTVAYRHNDVAFALNAGAVVTDTSCLIPVVDRLNIGSDGSAGTDPLNGHLGKLAYYPLRVTNAQLQAITG